MDQVVDFWAEPSYAQLLLAEQKRRCYALDQLVARLPHFAYQDAQDLLGKASEMSERLKEKLKAAELAARTAGAAFTARPA